jgi:pantoate--beta-alanine ligase
MARVQVPVLSEVAELRRLVDEKRSEGRTIGLVGTSGGLHEGHLSLIRWSADAGDFTVLWLFTGRINMETGVLPSYERDHDRDERVAIEAGSSVIFRPPNELLFPGGPPLVRLHVAASLATPWPGIDDDAFVTMVATIMTKALNVVGPCRLYCGEKDWQNVATLLKTVVDLSIPSEIVPCPSVRDDDGVVLGSRNAKLTEAERAGAPAIKRALDRAASAIEDGERDADRAEALLRQSLEGVGDLQYAVIVDAHTLQRMQPLRGDLRILVSVGFGATNLMDNVGVTAP